MNKTYQQIFIDQVAKEIINFENEEVFNTDKVKFNQYKILKKIRRHQNNTFEVSSNETRFFFNIGDSRVDTVVKKIDLDSKDADLQCEKDEQAYNILLKSELKEFFKDTNQGQKIDEYPPVFSDEGNVVAKKDKDKIYRKVNLLNLKVIDQTAESLEDTTVIEEHKYNFYQFKKQAFSSGWENWETVIDTFGKSNDLSRDFYVYERYGEMLLSDFKKIKSKEPAKGDDKKYIETMGVVAIDRPNLTIRHGEISGINGELLFLEENEGEKTDYGTKFKPYIEAHFDDYKGRWLRKGIREKLFEIQERSNILINNIYKSMKWSDLHLLWTSDPSIAGKNIFSALEHGDIILADNLSILPLEERNLSAQSTEWNKLMDLADRACQSFEVATGEGLPSGTTLGQVQLQTATVGEHFTYKRKKLGLFFEEIYNTWVLPDLVDRVNSEHFLEINGSPEYMDSYITAAVEGTFYREYLKLIAMSVANGGNVPTQEDVDQIKEMIKTSLLKKPKQICKILKDAYKGRKLKASFIFTGESQNKQARINNGLSLLNTIINPVIMSDPMARGIVLDIANSLGFDTSKASTKPAIPQQGMQMPQNPQPNNQQPNNPQSIV